MVRVPEGLRQRRLEIAVALVEEDCEDPARPQHSGDLSQDVVVGEPVERLADEHRIDRRILERDRVSAALQRLGLGNDALEHGPHPVQRLDRDHAGEAGDELPRQLPGTGRQVEHDRVGREIEGVESRLRVPRPSTLVGLGGALEAAREVAQTPERRKARLSRSISRAITSRCTSCVPS